jgi:hypothetical protein
MFENDDGVPIGRQSRFWQLLPRNLKSFCNLMVAARNSSCAHSTLASFGKAKARHGKAVAARRVQRKARQGQPELGGREISPAFLE